MSNASKPVLDYLDKLAAIGEPLEGDDIHNFSEALLRAYIGIMHNLRDNGHIETWEDLYNMLSQVHETETMYLLEILNVDFTKNEGTLH